MHPHAAWKIGVAAFLLTVMAWLPTDLRLATWCGPAACLGQMAGEVEINPERIITGSRSLANFSFTGCINISGNIVTETNSRSQVEIANSFRSFTGLAQVNQSGGALNSQLNLVGIAGVSNGGRSQVSMSYQSRVSDNILNTSNNTYQAAITGESFRGGTGVAQVNQTAGNMNAQINAFNVSMGGRLNLTDNQLCAVRTNNSIYGPPNSTYATKLDLEGGAFKNFTGLVTTNQVAGNMNQVSTVFNVHVVPVP
jgi:hypothetical protein